MKDNPLRKQWIANKKGVTLIELLIVLVISAIVIGGVYKVFIAQTRAYTVQDQVAEVQQDVRGAMEIMVRDIRMAGFQQINSFSTSNPAGSALITATPIIPVSDTPPSITVNYQYGTYAYTVNYQQVNTASTTCPNPPCLQRTCTTTPAIPSVPQCNGTPDTLLNNVSSLNFGYGIDLTGDGVVNGINSAGVSVIPDGNFATAAGVLGSPILAVQVTLIANPAPVDPDVQTMVSQRRLTSVAIPRNVFIKNTTLNRSKYKLY